MSLSLDFKLRPILFAIGIIAILASYWFCKPLTIDQKIKQVTDLGGFAFLDIYCTDEACPIPPTVQGAKWSTRFKNWLSHPMHKIVFVDLKYTQISDDDLTVLEDLDDLIRLNLTGTKVSDDGIESLGHLKNLRYLSLGETQITQTGIDHLKHKNPSLKVDGWSPEGNVSCPLQLNPEIDIQFRFY
tara:strand:+ start:7728 stop:8285 length:558 start_codon:yes stop_codon:yes gene_type:complete